MNKITFCIPSKNNLRYLKNSINSIRENSAYEHDIIVFIDADNDGTEEWCNENNVLFIKNKLDTPQGIAAGYNRCIELAKTNIVCMFHADMYMAKGFDTGILKHLKPLSVVSGTRIEPPLHPEGKEKIIKNFGLYPEDFIKEDFDSFVVETINANQDKTTKGIFAPWACYKEDITSIGMHDERFHSYHEDSDMFNRFILNGYEIIQSWEAYVYHLTCRGGQFQDGVEQVTKDPFFHEMKNKAMRNYVRKWGYFVRNNEYQYPIIPHKYNIGFKVHNCNLDAMTVLEPWCSTLYTDDEMGVLEAHYYDLEQKHTWIDLKSKLKLHKHTLPTNDIVVEFDTNKLNQQSFNLLIQLPEIIAESGEVGEFELDIFKITIKALNTYEDSLVHIYNKQ
jgi:glycosyltransferase involved in cell wall biosynthesis